MKSTVRTSTARPTRSTAHDVVQHKPGTARRASIQKPAAPAPKAAAAPAEDDTPVEPSARTLRLMEAIKRPFLAFADDFTAITASRLELAPKFMKAFGAYTSDVGGTFVSFVRALDPTVPKDRAGYRAHASYAAADYLRRLQGRAEADTDDRPKPASPVDVIAQLLAAMTLVVDDPDAIWTVFQSKLHWTERQVEGLKQRTAEAEPLFAKSSPQARRLTVAA